MTDHSREELKWSLKPSRDGGYELAWVDGSHNTCGWLLSAEQVAGLFDQAHTPTDDEREALFDIINRAMLEAWTDAEEYAYAPAYIRDAILTAGFRRTAQGDSSDGERGWSTADRQAASDEAHRRFDEWAETRGQDIAGASINGFILGAEWWKSRRTVQGEPTDVRAEGGKPWCAECGGPYPLDTWPGSQYGGHWDTCPKRHAPAEPQGEPTDAQVEAALDALSRFNQWTENPSGAMRAALSAAFKAGGEGR